MWFKSRDTIQIALPSRCFISHSYRDAKARNVLLKKLPKEVEPFIFPPITVAPEKLISNELIEAILRCEGLIYLKGGYSDRSFWVAFERDYALRSEKKVFSFDVHSRKVKRDDSSPLSLNVYLHYSAQDQDRVTEIATFMKDQRFFWTAGLPREMKGKRVLDPNLPLVIMIGSGYDSPGPDFVELEYWYATGKSAKGYHIYFWSQYYQKYYDIESIEKNSLLVLLDDTIIPPLLRDMLTVQLFNDEKLSRIQRLDNLIVALYWLIYRISSQKELD